MSKKVGIVKLQFNEELEEKYNQQSMDSGVKKMPICSDCISNSITLFMERSLPKVTLFEDLVHDGHLPPKSA
ncbi:hypothetical protein OAK75_09250 [Bacteriovoracales bacterium]|nr:hypothetical protein [Bacteriovoracales bacterium]